MFLNTSCTFSNNSIGATEFHEEENSLTIALENASFLRTFSPGALDEEVLRFPSAFEFPARTNKKSVQAATTLQISPHINFAVQA